MSVNPGFGGQALIDSAVDKVSELRRCRQERKLDFLIEIDGGVKVDNTERVTEAGADVLVIGTGIFQHKEAGVAKKYGKIIADIHAAMARGNAAPVGQKPTKATGKLKSQRRENTS